MKMLKDVKYERIFCIQMKFEANNCFHVHFNLKSSQIGTCSLEL